MAKILLIQVPGFGLQSCAAPYSLQSDHVDILDLNLEITKQICGNDYKITTTDEGIRRHTQYMVSYRKINQALSEYSNFENLMDQFKEEIQNYTIFALSLITYWNQDILGHFTRYIKKIHSNAIIAIGGGVIMDGYPEIAQSLLDMNFDIIINGDGKEQLEILATTGEVSHCYSSAFMKDGVPYNSSLKNNTLKAPEFHSNLLQYPYPQTVTIPFNVGCYWGRCSFCYDKSYAGAVSYEKCPDTDIINHMVEMKAQGIPYVFLGGSGIKKNELRELLKKLNPLGDKVPRFCFECRSFEFDDELALLLKESKIGKISFGLESPEEAIANDIYDKGISIEGFKRGLSRLDKLGFRRISVNITISPVFCKKENLDEIIKFLNHYDCISDYIVYLLEIPQGTAIEETASETLDKPMIKPLEEGVYEFSNQAQWYKESITYLVENVKKPFSLYSDSGSHYQMCCLLNDEEMVSFRERYYKIHKEQLESEFKIYVGPGDLVSK